jgi:hypothetical protein
VPVGEGSYRLQLSQHLKGGFCAHVCKVGFRSSAQKCSVSMSTQKNVEWLWHHTEQYRSITNDMCEAIGDFDKVEKLGQGFSSADSLEEIDIGDGITPRLTFVNKNMSIIKLLRNYIDCFTWNYCEMPNLSQELVEHWLPIKTGFRPYKQPVRRFNPIIHDWVKEEVE